MASTWEYIRVVKILMAFDLRSEPDRGASHAELTTATLDMCEWADKLEGADSAFWTREHHGSPDGYIPSPIVLTSAVAGRTRRMTMTMVLLAPFYNPVRLAEDLAILDLISRGRCNFLLTGGYNLKEFTTFDVDPAERGRFVEECVEVLKRAWTGEPFQYRGKTVHVTPRPYQDPRPRIILGGSTKIAARRAARVADGFQPTDTALLAVYRDELVARGKAPPPEPKQKLRGTLVAVSNDPDRTWREVGLYCLHEMNSYAAWIRESGSNITTYREMATVDELRTSGDYLVMTPEECIERARAQDNTIAISPLTGGISPVIAWQSLRLIETEVLPHLITSTK